MVDLRRDPRFLLSCSSTALRHRRHTLELGELSLQCGDLLILLLINILFVILVNLIYLIPTAGLNGWRWRKATIHSAHFF